MSKYDDIWIVVVGIVFISIVVVLLLVPRSYFKCKREHFESDYNSMSLYMNRTNSDAFKTIRDFDKVFKSGFENSSSLPTHFRDGSALLIARRCYQFVDLEACPFEDDNKKRECIIAYARQSRNMFKKIGSSIDKVMTFFDSIASMPSGQPAPLMKTYKLMVSSFDQVRDTIITDLQTTKTWAGAPLKGSVYVLLFQIPYWRSSRDEFIAVQYNAHTRGPYFDGKGLDPSKPEDAQLNQVVSSGPIFTYAVVCYGGYIKGMKQPLDYDWMDGTKLNPNASKRPRGRPLIYQLDDLYSSKDDRCLMRCSGSSDMYCGCASSPPLAKLGNIQSAYPMDSLSPAIAGAFGVDASKNLFGGVSLSSDSTGKNVDPKNGLYQARCNGPELPTRYSERTGLTPSKTDTPSTFGTLYRVNPSSITLNNPSLFAETKGMSFYDPTLETDDSDEAWYIT